MAYSSSPTALWAGSPQTILNSVGSATYEVYTVDDLVRIYAGSAVNRPDESEINVDIADIAADYCRQAAPDFNTILAGDNHGPLKVAELVKFNRTFRIVEPQHSLNIDVDFIADWSYRDAPRGSALFLSDPVLAVLPAAGVLVISDLYTLATSAVLKDGDSATLATITDITASAPHNIVFPLTPHSADTVTITCGTRTATFSVDSCLNAALYYVNAFGGWDCLPLEPITKRTDAFTRSAVSMLYTPSELDSRSRRDYAVETVKTIQVRTPWLTDEQSDKFSLHVPGSVLMYLFLDGAFYPVTCEDTQIGSALTTSSNGRTPVRYTLNLRLAQYRFRK